MKLHISLVGGQPVPVYRGIVEKNAKNVLLICTASSARGAHNILSMLGDLNCLEPVVVDALDFAAIKEKALEIADKYANDTLEINLTGGSKPMDFVFYEIFKTKDNAHLFFINQNNIMTDLKSLETTSSEIEFSIDDLCRINGTGIKSYVDLKEYTVEDFACLKRLEKLRNCNYKAFNNLTTDLMGKQSVEDRNSESEIIYDDFDRSYTFTIYTTKNRCVSKQINSPHAFSLISNAGWWEVKVAKLLSNWNKAQDIWVNNCFASDSGKDKNEIDVIVKTADKLLFVECKTQIYSPSDLDKFNSAVNNYGGTASKKLFVNYELLGKKKRELILIKCAEYGILYFSYQDAKKIEIETKKSIEAQLFELIDFDYKRSNSK